MILDISSNRIDLIKGHQGIVVENVINATINNNNILHDNALYNPRGQVGVHVIGGLNNVVSCNTVTQTDPIGAYIVGFACESSPGMTMARNTADNTFGSISFVNDNETNCRIQYNDLKYNLGIPNIAPTGLFYNDAQTGPQGLQGNDWIGDFGIGALYEEGDGTYPYCNSLYHVSVGENVNNAINPVAEGTPQLCGDWFTTNGSENDYTCLHILSPNSIEKNSADLNLASGGTLSLSLGYKWSSEIGLYRKFTENPSLAIGDAVINGFMQVQQSQPVATMFGVRNSINGIEGGIASTLLSSIQSVLVQLETNKTSLLSYLENIDTDPSALASFNTLYTQTEALEQLLQSYLLSASNSMALSAASVRNTNNSISSSALPCTAERYVNGLYLETQIITPRALAPAELEAIRQIGLKCSKDAGSTVYLARAWYYLQTGLVLNTPCSSFMPPLDVIERNNQIQLAPRSDLVLTPNPADDNVSVNIPANLGESTMFLTDILGRLLLQRKIPESEEASILLIPTEGFANGVYWVSVKTKTRNSLNKKLVITH